jgi:RNA-directed DNA polymerase
MAGRQQLVKERSDNESLQRLLTHSYSGKALAVRRVTENTGKKTPGVDQIIWKTSEDKIRAVHALKSRGYQSQPLRRVYILKSDGKNDASARNSLHDRSSSPSFAFAGARSGASPSWPLSRGSFSIEEPDFHFAVSAFYAGG